ncbi:MAG: hypothetical protein JW821_17760 [Deltaproteobacteria bacterium]|nr:hypothetical protein [Deltaproteobacteria bacterium]
MVENEQVYQDLQRHLDRQAVGYPASKSGIEIRLLKHFFSPEEARLAMRLSYRPRSLEQIFDGGRGRETSFQGLEGMLDDMMRKGVKKEKETAPPETREDLYNTIMAKKKGKLGKAKLALQLMLKR